jgi:hypothetical protein
MAQDATTLVIPLWPAMVAGGGILTALIGVITWVFATFERKTDADQKHAVVDARVTNQEKILNEVAQNVSYIRGRIEPK